MYTNPSNPNNEDGDSNHGATMKQNGIFETQLRAWMNALSPEGRAAALSVKDNAFLFTLMHFASLSSSCGNCSDGTVAGIDGECTIRRESSYSCDFRVCALLIRAYSKYDYLYLYQLLVCCTGVRFACFQIRRNTRVVQICLNLIWGHETMHLHRPLPRWIQVQPVLKLLVIATGRRSS